MKFESLARWPLLMGAVVLFTFAGVTLEDGSGIDALMAVAAALIGSLLLGAWIWSLAVETERRHYGTRHPVWNEPSDGETGEGPPPGEDEGPSV